METITINKCPHCKQSHKYNLQVERTFVIKFMIMSNMNDPIREVKFIRIFSCPIKNDNFQATVTLYDSSSNRIRSVGDKTEINNDPDEK